MKTWMTAALAAGLVLPTASASAQRPVLRMTCHELLQGRPMRDATVYTVIGNTLYRDGVAGRVAISTEGRRLALSPYRDRGVVTRSYASHVRRGMLVTRTVYDQTGNRPMRARFTETFDFARQRYGSPDACHANAFR